MKNTKKKILSLMLVSVLIISSFSVFAQEEELDEGLYDEAAIVNQEEADLNNLKEMQGREADKAEKK